MGQCPKISLKGNLCSLFRLRPRPNSVKIDKNKILMSPVFNQNLDWKQTNFITPSGNEGSWFVLQERLLRDKSHGESLPDQNPTSFLRCLLRKWTRLHCRFLRIWFGDSEEPIHFIFIGIDRLRNLWKLAETSLVWKRERSALMGRSPTPHRTLKQWWRGKSIQLKVFAYF